MGMRRWKEMEGDRMRCESKRRKRAERERNGAVWIEQQNSAEELRRRIEQEALTGRKVG
jgi:hypothetical protein